MGVPSSFRHREPRGKACGRCEAICRRFAVGILSNRLLQVPALGPRLGPRNDDWDGHSHFYRHREPRGKACGRCEAICRRFAVGTLSNSLLQAPSFGPRLGITYDVSLWFASTGPGTGPGRIYIY